MLTEKKYLGEMLVEKGVTTPDKIESALIEQEHVRKVREKSRANEESAASIRVPAEKLDSLVNLVGELVTVQARLTQTASVLRDNELGAIAEEVERLTGELRDNTLNVRMLPIGTTFGRFKRLVRDLSNDLGKEIELITEGAETELDKTVIDRLNDPLVHIIRNSIDHGIELPSVREAQGKPGKGTIRLSASYSGASVLVTVRDDGAGLDVEAIRRKGDREGPGLPDCRADKEGIVFPHLRARFFYGEDRDQCVGPGRRHGRGEKDHRHAQGRHRGGERAGLGHLGHLETPPHPRHYRRASRQSGRQFLCPASLHGGGVHRAHP